MAAIELGNRCSIRLSYGTSEVCVRRQQYAPGCPAQGLPKSRRTGLALRRLQGIVTAAPARQQPVLRQ